MLFEQVKCNARENESSPYVNERSKRTGTKAQEREREREEEEERNDQDEVNARLSSQRERDNRCSPPLPRYNACKATGKLSEKQL